MRYEVMPKSKYETRVVPRFAEIKNWRRDGAEISWISKKLGISEATFYKYKNDKPEFSEILKESEMYFYDQMVLTAEDSLLKKLIDRNEVTEELVEQWTDGENNIVKQHKIIKKRLILADTTAIIFALKNHKGYVWNKEEKELMEARLEKLKIESKNIVKDNNIAVIVSEKLNNYLGSGEDN
jgi:hypothetical protein